MMTDSSWNHKIVSRASIAALLLLCAACGLDPSAGAGRTATSDAAWEQAASEAPAAAAEAQPTTPAPAPAEADVSTRTVCGRFVLQIREAARAHGTSTEDFLQALNDEFTGGTGDPFEMKEGLQAGRWNQRWFYGGHGGFRPEFDDAQRYPRGGNHQPGHFIAVFTIAARFGGDAASVAIAYAGDYDPGDEDDLRLSQVAIRLGAGVGDGSISPARAAEETAAVCR